MTNLLTPLLNMKFGSSVLRTGDDLPNAVHEIYRWVRTGYRVVALEFAIGDTTDRLLTQGRAPTSAPDAFPIAELLATGECSSAALLGVALDRAGFSARVLSPVRSDLPSPAAPWKASW